MPRSSMHKCRLHMLAAFMAVVAVAGCYESAEQKKRQRFSGEFGVISHQQETIIIHQWDGFDSWCPADGTIVPEGGAFTSFPWRSDFPEFTVVVWSEEGEEERKQQKIDLRGVVPEGVKGVTHFELDEHGAWSVSFVPEESP